MISTRFTELTGCSVPVQQAPIGDLARTPALPMAVARAGGHGMLAAVTASPAELEPVLAELAAERAPLVDFHQGYPDASLVELVHRGGGLATWQVGTAAEARAAEDAGCDVVVAQGIEAAGFTRGRAGMLALLQEVLEAVSVPVLAGGGIGTARGVAAVLAAGAAGVRIGTRFIAAVEAGADPRYLRALAAARAEDTVLTDRFSPPGVPIEARAIRTAAAAGDPFFAGESTGAVHRAQPAAEILGELADGAEQLLLEAARLTREPAA